MEDYQHLDGTVTIGVAHELLKKENLTVPITTLRNWVNELHQMKVHTVPRNPRGERVFSDKDLEILKFIADLKKRFGNNISMQQIGSKILEVFSDFVSYDPSDDSEYEGKSLAFNSVDKLKEFLSEEIQQLLTLKEEFQQQKEELEEERRRFNYSKGVEITKLRELFEEKILLLPDPEEEKRKREEDLQQVKIEMRSQNLNRSLLENRIRKKLREEAEKTWSDNPQKTGIIFKKENFALKEAFIQNYIIENFESEINKAFEE
ncbi:MerR family transcriptional regulator [Paenibacillus tepidiphilus]|uniref:MerR family transcriptional regulator n=1 Tax=Paenibacillus tepidiphilus TaxID=2608683 RepID=UPI0013A59257|nr:MerR family transcriptional regulator [Paenibacillus tepidiphilus]